MKNEDIKKQLAELRKIVIESSPNGNLDRMAERQIVMHETQKAMFSKLDKVERDTEINTQSIYDIKGFMPKDFPCTSNDKTKNPLMMITEIQANRSYTKWVIGIVIALLGAWVKFK